MPEDISDKLASMSVSRDDQPWTDEEKAVCLEVRKRLIKEKGLPPSAVGELELITITMNAKMRPDEAIQKFMTYYENLLGEYKIPDVWAKQEDLHDQWHRLAVAGVDEGGRQIMWVHGGKTEVEEEAKCIQACSLYFFAVHSDRHTLRNGISLVIDTSNGAKQKVGNEKKLQVAWQNYPTRPQGIYILGTNAITRITINALIAFASLFAKNKVIARIRFETYKELAKKWGLASLPEIHGGDKKIGTVQWVKERLESFPLMGLPKYVDDTPVVVGKPVELS